MSSRRTKSVVYPQRVSIASSKASKFSGKHRYISSIKGRQMILESNSWLQYWEPVVKQDYLTEEDHKFIDDHTEDMTAIIKPVSVPVLENEVIPDEVYEFISTHSVNIVDSKPEIVKSKLAITRQEAEKSDYDVLPYVKEIREVPAVVTDYYEKIETAKKEAISKGEELKMKTVDVASSITVSTSLSPGILQHIRMERGKVAEAPIIEKIKIKPGWKVFDEQMDVSYKKSKYYTICGKLDGSIRNEKGKLVGLVEVKYRQQPPRGVKKMLDKSNDGYDNAYDLRQIACYWKCLPDLDAYYLLEIYNGKPYLEEVPVFVLEQLWNEMEPILYRRSRRLIRRWKNYKKEEETKK